MFGLYLETRWKPCSKPRNRTTETEKIPAGETRVNNTNNDLKLHGQISRKGKRLNLNENGMDNKGGDVIGIQHARGVSEEHKEMVNE